MLLKNVSVYMASLCVPNFVCAIAAEREGFEPSVPFCSTHAFQACQLSHSCTSPVRLLVPPKTRAAN